MTASAKALELELEDAAACEAQMSAQLADSAAAAGEVERNARGNTDTAEAEGSAKGTAGGGDSIS